MTELTITKTIDIAAAPARVWAALTTSDLIAQWFGDTAEFTAEVGGAARFGWTDFGSFAAVVEHVDEPKSMSFRWASAPGLAVGPTTSTLVRFDLEETADGTRLTVHESGFENLTDPRKSHESNTEGWNAELEELRQFVAA